MPYGGAAPAGSAMTAWRAPPPQEGADPAAGAAGGGCGRHQQDGGAAVAQPGQYVLDPGEFGLGAGRESVLPARVVGQFLVAPVAFVERRVAEDGVGGELREGVGAQGVAGTEVRAGDGSARGVGVEGQAQGGEGGEGGVGLLSVQRGGAVDRAEQGAGEQAGSRTVRTCCPRAVRAGRGRFGEVRHQLGEMGRGQGVLARVGVQLPPEQKRERLPGPDPGGQFGGGAQERHGRHQVPGGGGCEQRGRRGGGGRPVCPPPERPGTRRPGTPRPGGSATGDSARFGV